MDQTEIIEKLRETMLQEMYLDDVTKEDLGPDVPLFGDAEDSIGMDSLDATELVVLVEKHFGVAIPSHEEALKAFTSLSTLADYIIAHQGDAV